VACRFSLQEKMRRRSMLIFHIAGLEISASERRINPH
jgi:hypothetical protein